ncbi:acyl-CoA dehydrogenase family protein [Rathayibacter toxicus]|uniref:Acyl-CoA dehydrogenase n=1 Tax=Rathayibacter toxicus TaxID=145458 RepID=A0A0U1PS74_9MICO|nr:acyl-CoA dehydrogenase family protein [Rathayibacter toxicus]ALS57614.1 hypothetical protein APU90_07420 [Rathayibacter toxicus]KKM44967.1 hypothetical protein VT73_07585 [Rathayibacter toxicus]PPG20715.1 acyl-CoA dehydrogenase [Rathayibacter toxicus]PPG45819.1 acyl-CoA dehydrogenase [Rathayibacter toxicus]PPH62398.1 acyl-CoA dehydrogenase [Rathayibacter toxicus]
MELYSSVDLPTDINGALALARTLGPHAPHPGSGRTAERHRLLIGLARHDLSVARTVEPHLDALAILAEADLSPSDVGAAIHATWGVFAAEGSDQPLVARRVEGSWLLDGVKPWCSLADRLDAALVTAHIGNASGERRLFSVGLQDDTVTSLPDSWHARGLTEVPSGPVRFRSTDARPVGHTGWYLSRPGFAWGGIGVAACWFGGALGIASLVAATAIQREEPHLLAHLGAIDRALSISRLALDEAATLIDSVRAEGQLGSLLAQRVRATVAASSEEILVRAGRALGPVPLAFNAEHAKRVADLTLYLRQHHAERDDAELGRSVLISGGADRW